MELEFRVKKKKDLGYYESGKIVIFLPNLVPKPFWSFRKFLKNFIRVLNHEYTHYFISKYTRKKWKKEEIVCELME